LSHGGHNFREDNLKGRIDDDEYDEYDEYDE
jgi:hypothetical protein